MQIEKRLEILKKWTEREKHSFSSLFLTMWDKKKSEGKAREKLGSLFCMYFFLKVLKCSIDGFLL